MVFVEIAEIALAQKCISQLIVMQNNTNVVYFLSNHSFQREKLGLFSERRFFFLATSCAKLLFYPFFLSFL